MVNRVFSLLSSRQSTILSGAFVLMVTVFASKFLGLIRDRLLAHNFSPDTVAVFLAAFRLPDLMFQLLIFGAVSVAFIPVFTDLLHDEGEKSAFSFANDVLNLVLLVFGVISLGIFVFARPLTEVIVPGFSDGQKDLTASLTQIITLGQILLTIGAFMAGIAQSYQRFILPALASLFYNIGIIFGILFLVPLVGVSGAAFGVVLGAALHIFVQFPLINSLGFKYSLSLNLKNSGIREIFRLMSMRTIGVAIEQINETVGLVLASLISTSSVTYLTFAQHLQTVPIGLFGATLAQAALPVLSAEKARGEKDLFKATLLTTIHQILFLTLPATAMLIVLRIPAVRLVFGATQFDWPSTVLTGKVMALLALGLSAQSLALLLVRSFYALKDTKTPVIVSILTVALNVFLSVYFIQYLHLEVWGLGVSYFVASNFSLVLLVWLLGKKVGGFSFKELVIPALKMFLAALVSAVVLYVPMKSLDNLVFDTTRTFNLLLLTGLASLLGIGIYLFLVWVFKVKELYTFWELFKKLSNFQSKIKSEELVHPPESI